MQVSMDIMVVDIHILMGIWMIIIAMKEETMEQYDDTVREVQMHDFVPIPNGHDHFFNLL
jgi:hypothetical protein